MLQRKLGRGRDRSWSSYLNKVALGRLSWQGDAWFKPPSGRIGCMYLGSPRQTWPHHGCVVLFSVTNFSEPKPVKIQRGWGKCTVNYSDYYSLWMQFCYSMNFMDAIITSLCPKEKIISSPLRGVLPYFPSFTIRTGISDPATKQAFPWFLEFGKFSIVSFRSLVHESEIMVGLTTLGFLLMLLKWHLLSYMGDTLNHTPGMFLNNGNIFIHLIHDTPVDRVQF